MRPDETLAGLLRGLQDQNAESLRLVETADLDAEVPVPRDIPWFPRDQRAWSVRWVILHVINELARHAGHADIIRETIDGATMYELVAALEGWAIDGWVKPWSPGSGLVRRARTSPLRLAERVLRARNRPKSRPENTLGASWSRPGGPTGIGT